MIEKKPVTFPRLAVGSREPTRLLVRILNRNDKVDDFILTSLIFSSSQMTESEKLRLLFGHGLGRDTVTMV